MGASAPQRSAPAAAPPPPAAAAPAPPPAAAPASSGGGMLSGLMGSMASGMAMGTGMSIANRAVDAVMGPRQTEVVHRHEDSPAPTTAGRCQIQQDQLNKCMQNGDALACQFYLDALKTCQQQQ